MNKINPTGTREWSDISHNVGKGCSHNCLYCYAAEHAVRTGQISSRKDWATEVLTPRTTPKKQGVIMFPTAHDITPFYLDASITAIKQMLEAGRSIVIVTKAHLECMKAICTEVKKHKDYYDKALIRITIGSMNARICNIFEPGAPSPQERFEALKHAFVMGMRTSVSVEPMLLGPMDAAIVYKAVEPYCRQDIWFGKMNGLDTRLEEIPGKKELISLIKEHQSDKNILSLYNALKNDPKVKWKDSIRRVVDRYSSGS